MDVQRLKMNGDLTKGDFSLFFELAITNSVSLELDKLEISHPCVFK